MSCNTLEETLMIAFSFYQKNDIKKAKEYIEQAINSKYDSLSWSVWFLSESMEEYGLTSTDFEKFVFDYKMEYLISNKMF